MTSPATRHRPKRPSFIDLFVSFPVRDRLLYLLYPDDLTALNSALVLELTVDELRRYTQYWYNIPVTTVSWTLDIRPLSYVKSQPRYHGLDIIRALPYFVTQWLHDPTVWMGQLFFRQFHVSAQTAQQKMTFAIEDVKKGVALDDIDTAGESWLAIRPSDFAEPSSRPARVWTWLPCEQYGRLRAADAMLKELNQIIRTFLVGGQAFA